MSAPLHLHLELDLREEPMVGRLSAGTGPALPFTGWVGLVATLERVTAAARESEHPTSEEEPHVP